MIIIKKPNTFCKGRDKEGPGKGHPAPSWTGEFFLHYFYGQVEINAGFAKLLGQFV